MTKKIKFFYFMCKINILMFLEEKKNFFENFSCRFLALFQLQTNAQMQGIIIFL